MLKAFRIFRGTAVLTIGQMLSYGLSFARNLILARVLTKADFGLAAIFGMAVTLLEVSGRMSFGQQIIQSKEGDSEKFMATSHAFQFVLSLGEAILIFALSGVLAQAFNVPSSAWAFAALAIVPLARGFEHLDYYRRQRAMEYLPAVLCDVVPQAVIALAAWPLALWLGDFRVFVCLMIAKALLGILMTHCLAQRAYRWSWRQTQMVAMWAFGWPLILNGLLMFASQQADQVLVSAFLPLNELAVYALAISLASVPWVFFNQVASSLMLPILSGVQSDSTGFCRGYRDCVEYAAVGAIILTLPLIVFGEGLVSFLYGAKYAGTGGLMAILGAMCAVRFLRFVPGVAAMAKGDTLIQLYCNVWRCISLPLAGIMAVLGGGVTMIAACGLIGEIVTTLVALILLQRRQGVPLRYTAGPVAYVLGFLAVELTLFQIDAFKSNHWIVVGWALTILIVSLAVACVAFPTLLQSMGMRWTSPREETPSVDKV